MDDDEVKCLEVSKKNGQDVRLEEVDVEINETTVHQGVHVSMV